MQNIKYTSFHLRTVLKKKIDAIDLSKKQEKQNFFFQVEKDVPLNMLGHLDCFSEVIDTLLYQMTLFPSSFIQLKVKKIANTFLPRENKKEVELLFTFSSKSLQNLENMQGVLTEKMDFDGQGHFAITFSKLLENVKHLGGALWLGEKDSQNPTYYFTAKFLEDIQKDTFSHINCEKPNENTIGLSILIAEDNTVNQDIINILLTQKGHHVDLVNDGQAVLEALDKNSYDLIVMDIQMPLLNGIETTKRIRSNFSEEKKKIPIVAVTAYGYQKGLKEECIQSGINAYLTKPLDHKIFLELIENITGFEG